MSGCRENNAGKAEQANAWWPRGAVMASLNPHLLNFLKIESQHEVMSVDAAQLMTPARLDVMAKYVYAREWVKNIKTEWGARVFHEHLRIWNEFREGDGSGKFSFEHYRNSFDQLLTEFRDNGFDERLGLIPVGSNDIIIDGSHRLAAALACSCPVKIVRFDVQPAEYDYQYFRERGLSEEILDDMVLQYCRLDSSVRVAVLFPVAQGRDQEIFELIRECGPIVYRKDIIVSRNGRANLIRLLYRNESWLGDGDRPTPGMLHHVNNRFVDYVPVKLIFFVGKDENANRRLKERIRALFDLGNDSVHINDRHAQTVEIAESVLNANSIHFLNHARPVALKNFTRLFKEFKDWMATGGFDSQEFCIDASAVLAAYGLRDANDLDFLFAGEVVPPTPGAEISCHNAELPHYGMALNDLVMDPRNYFYWDGIKFLALRHIRQMKEKRAEAKDTSDVYRIDALEGRVGMAGKMFKWYYTLPERLYSLRYQAMRTAKRLIPAPLLPVARAVYRIPQRLRGLMGPKEQVAIYRGFELHFSRGTSLLEWIRDGRIYEPDVSRQLVSALKSRKPSLCLDIGANIGLMTLNVLAEVPDARVVAFEPGPHQAELLGRTVTANDLGGHVTIVQSALSNRPGKAEFAVHKTRHASGDGFFDTKRSGRTRTTEVSVTTLDEWWRSTGQPQIDAIKIDTEGAELWVLQGGQAALEQCRPLVVFELHPMNLRVYPYEAADILHFLEQHGYAISTLTGVEVTKKNLEQLLVSANDYVASFKRD
jgi:FkbM family methyltransferase